MVAWYVTEGWLWQPMWASFFVISFIIYGASLPMMYGMLWVSSKYPIVTFSSPDDSHTLPTFARGPSPTLKVSRRPCVCDTSRHSEWLRSAASFGMTLDDTKRSLIKIETARLSLVVTEHPREEMAPESVLRIFNSNPDFIDDSDGRVGKFAYTFDEVNAWEMFREPIRDPKTGEILRDAQGLPEAVPRRVSPIIGHPVRRQTCLSWPASFRRWTPASGRRNRSAPRSANGRRRSVPL